MALTADGDVYSWGCGSDGRLGHKEFEGHTYLYKEAAPKKIEALSHVTDLAASYYHNMALSPY